MISRLRARAVLLSAITVAGCGADATTGTDPADTTATSEPLATAGAYDWGQFGGDAQHSGNDTRESVITRANVGSLARLFRVALGGVPDGAPILLTGVATTTGTRDVLFLTTRDGSLLARDARTGAALWSAAHGPGACKINKGSTACYTTSMPAADPGRAHVYSYGLDGFVHKHAVADGAEVKTGGWPQLATTKPYDEKSSPGLTVVTARNGASHLFVGNGGYPGDRGDYQGHVTIIHLADGTQTVFNTLCSDVASHFTATTPDCGQKQSAVWARAGVVYVPALDRVFGVTGNGDYNVTSHDWGDTIFALGPDGARAGANPLDSYTPTNFASLQSADADLGSTAPALLPTTPTTGGRSLGVQSGKDAKLRIVDLANLSGQGGPGHTGGELFLANVPQGGEVLTHPATWTNPADGSVWTFVANDSGTSGLTLAVDGSGHPSLVKKWQIAAPGTSPVVAGGVVFTESSGAVRGLDPVTGALLWQDTTIGSVHWASPMVANGVLYAADLAGNLSAYAPPTTTKLSVKVNFQLSGAPVPAGYLADTGAAYGDRGNGRSYGWNVDNSAQARWRKSASSPDERYDTLIHMQKPANPSASWELAVPSGTYSVRIVSGDPSFIDSVFRVAAEGAIVVDGTPTSATHWVDHTATVSVTDGRLTVTNAAGSSNNKIDFIEVTQQ